mmetsp:Transcript_42337/g.126924  ORF Transcript_42337/g.126924 Transcript_42337/m.126924 type:complete len:99 (+) Transcript_42337:158-454(+)
MPSNCCTAATPHRPLSSSFTLRVVYSKGTYIRSLAHDFGEALGTAAHMTSLRREAIGQYHVRDAWPLDDLLKELTAAKERLAEQGDAGAEQPLSEKEH